MTDSEHIQEQMQVDNKLIPMMRDAIVTVQMILFKVLRESVHDRYVDEAEPHHTRLAGAVMNNLFGTRPVDEQVVDFAADNRQLVERELRELSVGCAQLAPMLTDALRMKTICDNQEGIHSIPSLLMAKALGVLQEDRPLPMPSTFMMQVRALAAEHGLIQPMQVAPSAEASPE